MSPLRCSRPSRSSISLPTPRCLRRRRRGTPRLRSSLQPGVRHGNLADRPAAAPADRRLRPHAQAGTPALPAGRRCRGRQDDHDWPLHPRDALAAAAAPGPDRPRRPGWSATGKRTADALQPRLPIVGGGDARSGNPFTGRQRPAHRQRRYRWPASACSPGSRSPPSTPTTSASSTRPTSSAPTASRLHDPQTDATGWPRRWRVPAGDPRWSLDLDLPPPAARSRPRRTWARNSRTSPCGGCWSPRSWRPSTPSTTTRPTPADGTSSAAPRRRWSASTATALSRPRLDTLSYDLTQGPVSEQTLYDETTNYIETLYNRARILNRSAARLAMSVFQRRLASSTYALLRSFERRLEKLDGLIADQVRAR